MPATTPPRDIGEAEEGAGDTFYPRLLEIAEQVSARVLLVEVADMEQAVRVATMALKRGRWRGIWDGCEIWRDWPVGSGERNAEVVHVQGENVRVRGDGNGRALLAWRGEHGTWMIGKM